MKVKLHCILFAVAAAAVVLLPSCARLIESDLPPESAYRKTVKVNILAEERVISVEKATDEAKKNKLLNPSKNLASLMDFLSMGHVGEPTRAMREYAHVHASYRFAMASSNAYKHGVYGKNQFRITGWKRVKRYENRLGSAADIYEIEGKNAVVIAFRGTEFASGKDWIYGNLNFVFPRQYKEAELLFKLIRHRYGNKTKIITTGHSLGAGLALFCARSFPDVDAVVFDASPKMMSVTRYPSSQLHVVEKGEILTAVRTIWRYIPPNTFNPLVTHKVDYLEGGVIEQHNMYHLAFAILKHSARLGNREAVQLLKDNPVYE